MPLAKINAYDRNATGDAYGEKKMKRRDMMRSFAFAATMVPVNAIAESPEDCSTMATDLAGAMTEVYGGDWRVTMQQDFILICRKL